MSTHNLRHRRALSMHRRSGAQGSHDALAGRAQRHALGWRDLNPFPEPSPIQHVAAALALFAATSTLMAAAVVIAVQVLDWLGA